MVPVHFPVSFIQYMPGSILLIVFTALATFSPSLKTITPFGASSLPFHFLVQASFLKIVNSVLSLIRSEDAAISTPLIFLVITNEPPSGVRYTLNNPIPCCVKHRDVYIANTAHGLVAFLSRATHLKATRPVTSFPSVTFLSGNPGTSACVHCIASLKFFGNFEKSHGASSIVYNGIANGIKSPLFRFHTFLSAKKVLFE